MDLVCHVTLRIFYPITRKKKKKNLKLLKVHYEVPQGLLLMVSALYRDRHVLNAYKSVDKTKKKEFQNLLYVAESMKHTHNRAEKA